MSLWSLLCIICVLLNQTVLVDCRCSGKTYCPPSWLAFKDNCYLLVRVEYNYHAAEQHCQSLSEKGRPAHLVSIQDEEENQFVAQYTKSVLGQERALWIGYNDIDVEGVFIWIDGSPVGYKSWATGFPAGSAYGNQDCTATYNTMWTDAWCTNPTFSMCKMQGYTF